MPSSFWKAFLTVFIIAFAANVAVALLFNRFAPDARWSWDTTTTTAVIVALAAGWLYRKRGNAGR